MEESKVLQYYANGKSIKQISSALKMDLRTVYDILFPELYSHIKEENLPIVDLYLDKSYEVDDIAFELRIPHFHTLMVLYRYLLLRPGTSLDKYQRVIILKEESRTNEEIAEILGHTPEYVESVYSHKEEILDTIDCIRKLTAIYNRAQFATVYTPKENITHKENTEEIDARTFPLFMKGWSIFRMINALPYDRLTIMRSKKRFNKLNSVQPSKPSTLNDSIEPGAAKEAIKEHFQLPVKLTSQLPEQDDRYFDMYPPEEQEDVSHR